MDAPTPEPIAEPRPQPLLPPFLLSPATYLWLWALPVAVLLALNVQGYWLVEGNMSPEQHRLALGLGVAGLANLSAGLVLYGFTRFLMRNCRPVRQQLLDLPAIAVQVAYLWYATSLLDGLLPASVTAWIYPQDRYLFNQFSFATLPLFFGVFRLACAGRVAATGRAIATSLGLAVAAPVLLYFCYELLRLSGARGDLAPLTFAIGAVLFGLLLFVAIVRALMLGLRALPRAGPAGERVAIVAFALVLPVGGLLLNRSIPFPVDFQAWEVYALVAANTAILLAASWNHACRPRLCFCLLCATFPFSLYFFVVFLPYTPLSILAILALGAGFLVLAPTILFTLHLHLLNQGWRNPAVAGRRLQLLGAGVACGLALPAFFTVRGLADKAALNAALDYVYAPAISGAGATYRASLGNLRRALSSQRSYKHGIYYPLLSDYYAWLVFDNLVLPDEKLDRIEETFFGAAGSNVSLDPVRQRPGFWGARGGVRGRSHMPRAAARSHAVDVGDLGIRTAAAGAGDARVTLALTLRNPAAASAEFVQSLPVPAGAVVTGFRLRSQGVTVPGRIFERKTALWVYAMIRDSENRDPGLLFYSKPDELELRVFPVTSGTPITVEIDFLVPDLIAPADLVSRPNTIAEGLAQFDRQAPHLVRDGRGCVVNGGLLAKQLPAVNREAYLHLIVDRSEKNGYTGDLSAALRVLHDKFPAARRGRVTLANFDIVDQVVALTPLDQLAAIDPGVARPSLEIGGGFALDLALAHAIRLHLDNDLDRAAGSGAPPRPIFVILGQSATRRTIDLSLTSEWADLVPGLELDELGADGRLVSQLGGSASATPLLRLAHSIRPVLPGHAVRFAPCGVESPLEFWSPANGGWAPVPGIATEADSTPWAQAVSLQLKQQDYARSPGDSDVDLKALVGASRAAGILLPSTSYIVVENTAQWRVLDLSERQKLGQNAELGFLETPAPPALYVGIGFALWLWARRIRRPRGRRLVHAV